MRIFLLLLAVWLAAPGRGADDAPAPDVPDISETPEDAAPAAGDPIKRFDGHVTLTTADFTVPDGWELRWRSDQVFSVGVIRLDNTVVAGATARTVGSLYVPQGGTYRLRVKVTDEVPWDIAVYAIKGAPTDAVFYAPSVGPGFKPVVDTSPPGLTALPVVAPTPAPPVAAPLPKELTEQQKQSIVTIKGDRAQGAGFFMKHGDDTVLVTTQQLIANNPNWHALAANGTAVQVTKIEGASDRDVAMLSVKNFGYPALAEGDPMKLQAGDTLLSAGAGGDPLPPVLVDALDHGRILIGDLHAAEGSPLVLASTGRVVGIIGVGPQVLSSDNFDDQNFSTRDATALASVSGYGQRLDDVQSWETCEQGQLQIEAQFLTNFHEATRHLDAYLNGGGAFGNKKLWKADDKIKSANDSFLQDATGGNVEQRNQALHALIFELGSAADTDLDQIQQPANFYGYQRSRAENEVTYRKALKGELDVFNNDTARMDDITRLNN